MPNQANLFPPYQRHSQTSLDAADKIVGKSGTLRRSVYEIIWHAGSRGMTDEEVQNALAMNPSTERPRRVELMDGGVICDSGKTRLTRSGRGAVVWVAKPYAP